MNHKKGHLLSLCLRLHRQNVMAYSRDICIETGCVCIYIALPTYAVTWEDTGKHMQLHAV